MSAVRNELAEYVARLPPSVHTRAEDAYCAVRVPQLVELYRADPVRVVRALDGLVSDIMHNTPAKPDDAPVLLALLTGSNERIGATVRAALLRRLQADAESDASYEASDRFEREDVARDYLRAIEAHEAQVRS